MICPQCGERLPDEARFCVNCGRNLGVAPAPGAYVPAAQAYRPVQQPAPKKEQPKRWPVVFGIMLIIGAALLAAAVYLQLWLYHLPAKWFLANPESAVNMLLPILLYILAAVFFFTRTRRTPFVTAIPPIILAAWNFIYIIIGVLRRHGGVSLSATMMITFFICLAALFYLLTAAIRPRSRALAVIHLIICVLGSIAACFSLFLGASSVYSVLGAIATVIWYAVYSAAGLMIRPRES